MTVTSHGYRVIRRKGVNYYIHRLVAEEMLGRPLAPGEEVHHINGDGLDNRPENLEVLTRKEHKKRHRLKECKRGHDMTDPENIYVRRDTGVRQCKACGRIRSLANWRKRNG